MQKFLSVFAHCTIVATLAFAMSYTPPAQAQTTRVFELRTYTTHEGKLDDLLARFRNHTTKLFEKHGMTNEIGRAHV